MNDDKMIKVWRFEDAPQVYQELSAHGGDEDWIAFVPTPLARTWIPWLDRLDTCNTPQIENVEGGVLYIGAHA